MTHVSMPEAEAFKNAARKQWNAAAAGWNENSGIIRNWLGAATEAMLTMANIRPGMRVIDIAAGAGDQTLNIAARVGPDGYVLATDLSPEILEFAKVNALRAGFANVETITADGETLDLADESFDAAVSRLGIMFYPNPLSGLTRIYRVLKPGCSACTMVFSAPQANPCIGILMSTALRYARLPPRDPFQPGGLLSLGKPGLADELFRKAGFRNVASTVISAPFRLQNAASYLKFIRSSASPIQQILEGLDEDARNAAWSDMEQQLQSFETTNGWIGPNELLLTTGQR